MYVMYAYEVYVMQGELHLIKSYAALFLSAHTWNINLVLYLSLSHAFLLTETDLCLYPILTDSAGLISGLYNTYMLITTYIYT